MCSWDALLFPSKHLGLVGGAVVSLPSALWEVSTSVCFIVMDEVLR